MVENIKSPVSRFATFARGEGDGVESYCLVFGVRPVGNRQAPESRLPFSNFFRRPVRDPRSGTVGLVSLSFVSRLLRPSPLYSSLSTLQSR